MKASKKIIAAAAVLLLAAALFVGAGAAATIYYGQDGINLNPQQLAEKIGASYNESSHTITLTKDVPNGKGIFIGDGSSAPLNLIFDFGGYTYTVASEPVGSTGTENQGFHLEQGNTITLKNGILTSKSSSGVKMLVQNYSNLTLDKVTLVGSNMDSTPGKNGYVLSNNCGASTIKGGSNIYAKAGDFAFDICKYGDYDEPSINVDNANGKIVGNIEYTLKNGGGVLDIIAGEFVGDLKLGSTTPNKDNLKIEGGTFSVTNAVTKALIEEYKTPDSTAEVETSQVTDMLLSISETYTIFIPASFNFTKDTSGITYSSSASGVGVTEINVDKGNVVSITLTESTNGFKLKAGSQEIPYGGTFGGAAIDVGSAFCTTTDNVTPNTNDMKFTTTNGEALKGAGNFTDTLTFSAVIESANL